MKHVPAIAYLLLGLALGFVASGYRGYTWKYEIDVTSVATIIFGVFIAILLQSYASTDAQDGREEKKFLLEQLQRIQTIADNVRDDYIASVEGTWSKSSTGTAKANLRHLSNGVYLFELSAGKCPKLCSAKKHGELKQKFLKAREILTKGSYPNKPLDVAGLIEIEPELKNFSETVVTLQFEINRI